MPRLEDLKRFYRILGELKQEVGRTRTLGDLDWKVGLPERGVYFFFEPSEKRSHTGEGLRVVRVGKDPEKNSAKEDTTLPNRLGKHRGSDTHRGGGRKRDSVFRRHMGNALIKRDSIECPTWNSKKVPKGTNERAQERLVDKEINRIIRQMPFLWIEVNDEIVRGYIEKNTIELLSNYCRPTLDPPSDNWLGNCSNSEEIKYSGLWNSNYVKKSHTSKFLDVLEYAVNEMGG